MADVFRTANPNEKAVLEEADKSEIIRAIAEAYGMAVPDKALNLITAEANQLLAMEQMKMELISDGAAAKMIEDAIGSAWKWGGEMMSEIPKKFKEYFIELFKAALPSWLYEDDEEEATTTNTNTNKVEPASNPMGTPKQDANQAETNEPNFFYDYMKQAAKWVKPNFDGFVQAVTKKDNSPNPFYELMMQAANGMKPQVEGFIKAVRPKENKKPNPFYELMMQAANGLSPMVEPYKEAIDKQKAKEETKQIDKEKEKQNSIDLKSKQDVVKAMNVLTTAINGSSSTTSQLINKLGNLTVNNTEFQ